MTVAVLFIFSIFGAQLLRLQGFDASAVSKDAQSLAHRDDPAARRCAARSPTATARSSPRASSAAP